MHYILWSIHSDFCWNVLEFNLILKFSWHRLSRLSWSVIEVQNCRPESFHFISSSRFVFILGVVTLPSAASSFSLHRYSLDLLPPRAFFLWNILHTLIFLQHFLLNVLLLTAQLGLRFYGLRFPACIVSSMMWQLKSMCRNLCTCPLYTASLIDWMHMSFKCDLVIVLIQVFT